MGEISSTFLDIGLAGAIFCCVILYSIAFSSFDFMSDTDHKVNTNISDYQRYLRRCLILTAVDSITIKMDNLNISRDELANKLGISLFSLDLLLNNSKPMTLEMISDICSILNIRPSLVLWDL